MVPARSSNVYVYFLEIESFRLTLASRPMCTLHLYGRTAICDALVESHNLGSRQILNTAGVEQMLVSLTLCVDDQKAIRTIENHSQCGGDGVTRPDERVRFISISNLK